MIRRFLLARAVFLLVMLATSAGAARAATGRVSPVVDRCTAALRSASGTTEVRICPAVVPSGRLVNFQVHSLPNEPVTLLIRYPNGTTDRETGMTDATGQLLLSAVMHYNPLYRYAQVPFVLDVGGITGDVITGAVRVAQISGPAQARIQVRPLSSKDWCGPDHCIVRDNTLVVVRIDTDPSAEVQMTLLYPNGETTTCPGNDLTGGSGMFAASDGVFICRLPVYYDLPGGHSQVVVLVQATITTSTYTIPLQYKLWLRAK
jgi:hypothetical protein